jgi:putative DNA primase/helicase
MSRRIILCSLDPKVERPELRTFDRNPVEIVKADRGRYVHAALTIVRAYRQAADAPRPKPLGSFEDWSNTIRGALVWLGMADPVDTMELVRASDTKLEELMTVLTQWQDVIGTVPVTTASLIKTAEKRDTKDFNSIGYVNADFREALLAVAGSGGAISSRRLGKWLGKHKGRIVEKHFIEQQPLFEGSVRWKLCKKD